MSGELSKPSRWRDLLDLAFPAIDYVFRGPQDPAEPDWTLGGGTAIAFHLDHRVSYDIDIFVPGTKLKYFTPAKNPGSKLISDNYQWPGHYLKFELEFGEIDFLSPGLLTEPGYSWAEIAGRAIAVETPEEVIVKKIRYRSERFTRRDTFDLAAVALYFPSLAEVLAKEVPDALQRLSDSLNVIQSKGCLADIEAAIVPTENGQKILPQTFDLAHCVVEKAANLAGIDVAKVQPEQKWILDPFGGHWE